jgi:hypothetical protein
MSFQTVTKGSLKREFERTKGAILQLEAALASPMLMELLGQQDADILQSIESARPTFHRLLTAIEQAVTNLAGNKGESVNRKRNNYLSNKQLCALIVIKLWNALKPDDLLTPGQTKAHQAAQLIWKITGNLESRSLRAWEEDFSAAQAALTIHGAWLDQTLDHAKRMVITRLLNPV